MTPKILRHVHRLVASLALGSSFASVADAQLGVDRSEVLIRPAIVTERIGVITVTNASDKVVQAVVKTEDWDRSEDGGNRWFPMGTVKQSCGGRLTVFPLTLSLDPGASQSVRLVLADSAVSLTRECWSAVVLETAQPPAQRGGVSYIVRTAVKVYVQPNNLATAGEITDVNVRAHAGGQDSLEVWFRNAGERHYVARGSVEFRRADNSVAGKVELPEYYILPGARQRGFVEVPKLPPGDYVAIAIVDFGGDDLAAMQLDYTARAAIHAAGTPTP